MKSLFIFLSILTSCAFFISSESKVGAYLTGYSPVTYQITKDNTPIIEGSLRSWCDDVVVGIGTDQSNTKDYVYFFLIMVRCMYLIMVTTILLGIWI